MQTLICILVAIMVLGLFVCKIAIITALKSGDKEMASVLIGYTIAGLVIGTVTILIVLIFHKI